MALSKITADSLGANAVTANAISNTAIIAAVGYTPANKAGDTFTGNVVFSANATVTGVATFSNTTAHTGAATFSNTVAIGSDYITPYTGFKNRIINGDMRIDQRNAGTLVNPMVDSTYYLDRFRASGTQTSKLSIGQNAGSVTPPAGFTNYMGFTSLSAYSITSSDIFGIAQNIEGYNVADFAWGTASASAVTLSFRVYSSLTGTFGGSLRNSAGSRSYPFSYSISAANTWTTISITIAGDTSGTWLITNGIGILLFFSLGSGSTYSGTAGSWSGSTYTSATGATSVVGTSGATFYITGVQLEKGSTATAFDYRSYGQELQLCQRYFQTLSQQTCWGIATNSQAVISFIPPVVMRATPSLAIKGNGSYSSTTVYYENAPWQAVGSLTGAAADAGHLTPQGGDINVNGTFSSLPVNAVGNVFNKKYPLNDNTTGQSYLTISAEL